MTARAVLLVLLLSLCGAASAAPRVGLVTMGPGEEYWARFGHNAILIEDDAGRAILYNFGYFDFEQPNFLTNFLRGKMLYRLLALRAEADLAQYADAGRGAIVQWLDLAPEAAERLAADLAENARPENAEYRYDYFDANCSTRVRDALNAASGGLIRAQTEGSSRGLSYRSEALRLAAPEPWLYWGIHLGLGVATDRVLTRWDEAFVPEHLAAAVRRIKYPDGRPLVLAEEQLLPHRIGLPPAHAPRYRLACLLLGTVLAAGALLALRGNQRARMAACIGLGSFWVISGLIGTGLLLLWAFTDHDAAWANRNALLFNPLQWLLLAALPALRAGRPLAPWLGRVAWLVFALGLVALGLYLLALRDQDTAEWLALTLPLHFAGALLLHRRDSTGRA